MKAILRRWYLTLPLLGLLALSGGATPVLSEAPDGPTLPDLVPCGVVDFRGGMNVSNRLGGPTLEFPILTANIGGQDFVRPRNPANPAQWLVPQIYQYYLFQLNETTGEWDLADQRRKNTICMIDDTSRGSIFPQIQLHGPRFNCGGSPGAQGVSRGWADDYFRGLTGQWVFIGARRGIFLLMGIVDPDFHLQTAGLPSQSRDASVDNNFVFVIFIYSGATPSQVDFAFEIRMFQDP